MRTKEENDYYNKCFKEGEEYQDFVKEKMIKELGIPITLYKSKKYQLKGECFQGIEIKYNSKFSQYNNLYIETKERSSESYNFVDAGIYRNDNSWLFITGDYNNIYIFSTKFLKMLHSKKIFKETRPKNRDTSRGFLISRDDAEKYCLKKIEV